MAVSQAANAIEKVLGHQNNSITAQDITNPAVDRSKYGHPTETMKALCWMGKNNVQMQDVPRPIVVEDRDVILKVTGSTVCGSDMHLLHGAVIQLQKGDILGHEFCGVVDSMGSAVKGLKPVIVSLRLSRLPAVNACTARRSYLVNASVRMPILRNMACMVDPPLG